MIISLYIYIPYILRYFFKEHLNRFFFIIFIIIIIFITYLLYLLLLVLYFYICTYNFYLFVVAEK
jgi:hypothetical protein